ncbi:hypothetical protein SRM_00430 [Salinibacter ruber M8]|uniref:Uncharacterized protein n=1 Tax=Salinibacter ruber (strain M8) TaxID=761659 RepID=D5H5P6_SALRM|nr:hypothetical protein SRM_00430 [Salinibacter ruber M8]
MSSHHPAVQHPRYPRPRQPGGTARTRGLYEGTFRDNTSRSFWTTSRAPPPVSERARFLFAKKDDASHHALPEQTGTTLGIGGRVGRAVVPSAVHATRLPQLRLVAPKKRWAPKKIVNSQTIRRL